MILTYHKGSLSLSLSLSWRSEEIRSAVSKVLGGWKKQMKKQNKIVGMCCLQVHIPMKSQELVQQGVCHIVALPFYIFKSILMQTKNYESSNTSSCKNIIFKKSSERNKNPSRYYNSLINLKFQHKPRYHLPKILI
jgi:hypothetical protein